MEWLTEDAKLECKHGGKITNKPSQDWVTIEGRRVLVENDPEGREISWCPNFNPPAGIRPCSQTLKVAVGYSTFIKVDDKPVSLVTVTGLTNGTPPGTVKYIVKNPGQELTNEGDG